MAASGLNELLEICAWTGRHQLSVRLGRCALTTLVFERELLNSAGELAMLRSLVNEEVAAESSTLDASVITWLRSARESFKSVQEARCYTNPASTMSIASAQVRTGFLGLGSTVYALAIGRSGRLGFLCEPVAGKRGRAGWLRG